MGVLAIAIGVGVGILLFVPFVAISYRRRGRLTLGRTVLWIAALVYFWAIWTYTLLPLPDPAAMRCAGVNLDFWAFVGDIRGAIARPGALLLDPAIQQLVLNVVLFMPLGFFVRVLGGRGVVVATLVGLGVSGFIETTQITGVWGMYPCAYRVFDVDDLLTNTLGAFLGSLVALAVPARLRGTKLDDAADEPRPVTKPRRILGAVCDLLGTFVAATTLFVVLQIALRLMKVDADAEVVAVVSDLVPTVIWLVVVLVTGRTVGDHAVELRYTGGSIPTPLARILRYLAGIGGYQVLGLIPGMQGWQNLFALVSIIMLLSTKKGRGLPGLVSNQALVDARAGTHAKTA